MSRRRREPEPDVLGVLLVDKPAGPTSHDVVAWVRWVLGLRRVGHCGTLDPSATGLLVIALGQATKLAPYLTGQDKSYRARFVLGASTTTLDAEGEVVETVSCPPDIEARIPGVIRGMQGSMRLPPPAFSAVHVDGQRAHALARAGQAPNLPPRPMTVHAITVDSIHRESSRVYIDAHLSVSKGTYIRSLAEELGRSLGVPSHLGQLHRTRSGMLQVDHVRAIGGIVAQPLESALGRPPRWRLGLQPCLEAPRDVLAARLLAGVVAPAQAVPLPLLRVREDMSGQRAMIRLASGQPIAHSDPGLYDLARPTERFAVVGAEPDVRGLVVVRCEADGDAICLRPERVVVPPRFGP